MKNLKLSIVVVSLNTKNQFLKTIKSVNSQTYKNYEIIVVDGNSTDGTAEEILKIKNKSLRYLIKFSTHTNIISYLQLRSMFHLCFCYFVLTKISQNLRFLRLFFSFSRHGNVLDQKLFRF